MHYAGLLPLAIIVGVSWPGASLEAGGSAQGPSPRPADIVTSFLNRQDPPVRTYRARRRLEARNDRYSREAWLEVITELGPNGFSYQPIAQGGSAYVLGKVLRPALDAERDLIASGATAGFNEANYRLTADGVEGQLARIRVTPLRKDKRLVDGWLLVSPHDTDLVAVKGQLAQTPSFWTSRVDIVRRYARIAGVRVPIALESIAEVKIAGRSTFRMDYTYESVNGVAVVR